jgi:hypothetical protein
LEHGQAYVASSRRERRHGQEAIEHLPEETVARIQGAGCKAQRKRVFGLTPGVGSIFSAPLPNIGRRNVISNSSEDRQLESLWRETNIGDVLPWEDIADEAERLLAISKASRNAANEGQDDGEQEK